MESSIGVALAAKLLRLFPPDDERFLAFPLSGAAFTNDELDIFSGPGSTAEQLRQQGHHRAQFSRLLNAVPTDTVRYQSRDSLLFDEFAQVLSLAVMARSVLTVAETDQLAAADDYLSDTTNEQGLTARVLSAPVVAYYQHKEVVDDAERTYLDAKITAELSEDTEERRRWADQVEPELRAVRDRARQEWQTLGYAGAVEAAQATVQSLRDKDPGRLRLQLLAELEECREVDLVANDPGGAVSTYYSPSDIFSSDGPWTTVHLSREELTALLAEAPAELRAGVGADEQDITSATVEYADVTVVRPWFEPAFFKASSWRLPPGEQEPVSDGGMPRSGRIPAYVSSMIVARRVTVERRAQPAQTGPPSTVQVADLGFLTLSLQGLDQHWSVADRGGAMRRAKIDAVRQRRRPRPAAVPQTRVQVRRGAPTATATQTVPLRTPTRPRAVRDPTGLGGVIRRLGRPSASTRPDLAAVRDHRTPPPPPLTPRPTAPRVEEVSLDGVVVLAYRCRRVPACPRPDAGLDWGEPVETADPAVPFPLLPGHVYGADRSSALVHSGHADAADRPAVRLLQQGLAAAGHEVDVDGFFGPQTAAAVRADQDVRGLEQTGSVGPDTWTALMSGADDRGRDRATTR